ncbi:MAG: hypothetical protein ACYC8T_37275 [Myxococcaceae bacterium]
MSRSNLKPALLISLALHAGLAAYLATRPAPVPVSPPAPLEWVEVEVKEVEPAPAPEPKKKKKIRSAQPPSAPPLQADSSAATPPPPAPAAGAPQAEAPLAEAAPPAGAPGERRISLLPRFDLPLGGPGIPVPSARGRTLRPDDPSFSKEVQDAEAEHRVEGRVTGFMEDTLSEARVQRGLPHPYFTGVGEAARSRLDADARAQNMRSGLGEVAAQFGKRYLESIESYAKTGNPNLGPSGAAPRMSEKLQERAGNDPDKVFVRALVQAAELSEDLKSGRPILSLTLEMRQSRGSTERSTLLVKGSGSASFDAFVLGSWPEAVEQAGPPPAEAFRSDELRSVWAVEGWLRMSKKLERAMSYLPSPGALGIPVDKVLPKLTEEGYRYEFRARLLRVY